MCAFAFGKQSTWGFIVFAFYMCSVSLRWETKCTEFPCMLKSMRTIPTAHPLARYKCSWALSEQLMKSVTLLQVLISPASTNVMPVFLSSSQTLQRGDQGTSSRMKNDGASLTGLSPLLKKTTQDARILECSFTWCQCITGTVVSQYQALL